MERYLPVFSTLRYFASITGFTSFSCIFIYCQSSGYACSYCMNLLFCAASTVFDYK